LECGLPAYGPAFASGAGRVQAHDGQVDAFGCGSFSGGPGGPCRSRGHTARQGGALRAVPGRPDCHTGPGDQDGRERRRWSHPGFVRVDRSVVRGVLHDRRLSSSTGWEAA
jgi:hypothetical protein